MYRDDNDAMYQRLQVTERQANELRQQNEAMRVQVEQQHNLQMFSAQYPAFDPYMMPVQAIPDQLRGGMAYHTVSKFPVWAVGLLNIFTLGLFPLIHFGLIHDRMPRITNSDPSSGKAIGFSFIPYFNLYWVFANSVRLAKRLNLQFRLRGRQESAPTGMMIACSVFTVIPYINLLIGLPIMWTIGVCLLQRSVNQVAELDPHEWIATPALPPASAGPPAGMPPAGMPQPGMPPAGMPTAQ